MRNTGNHTPPEHTQPCPADNTSAHVMRQVRAWEARQVSIAKGLRLFPSLLIHAESAREIASWWQSFGLDGMPFAEFASSGTLSPELLPALDREIAACDHVKQPSDGNALRALRAYVLACPVTVWRVSYVDACSAVPQPEVVERVLQHTTDGRGALHRNLSRALCDLFEEYADTEWPDGCECTETLCTRCVFEAHTSAWVSDTLSDILRTGTGYFGYAREDVASHPSWGVECVDTIMGTEFGAES